MNNSEGDGIKAEKAVNFIESLGVFSKSPFIQSLPLPSEEIEDLYLSRTFVSGTLSRLMTVFSTMHDIRITVLQKDSNTNSTRFFSKTLDKEKLIDEAKKSQLSDQTAERFMKALVYGLSVPDDQFEISEDGKVGIILTFPIVPTVDDAIHNLEIPESLPAPQMDFFDSFHAVFRALQRLQSTTQAATNLAAIKETSLDSERIEKLEKQHAPSSSPSNHFNHHRDVFNPMQGVARTSGSTAGIKRKR